MQYQSFQPHTLKSCAISRTNLWNGNLRISNSVLFWYLRISLHIQVPTHKYNVQVYIKLNIIKLYASTMNDLDKITLRYVITYRRATVPGR